MEKNKEKKKKLLKILGIIGICILVLGLSYALFRIVLVGRKKMKLSTASFKIELLDANGNNIEKTSDNTWEYVLNIDNQAPIADEKGMRENGFQFKIKNSGSMAAKYDLYLDDMTLSSGEERMADKYVKYSLALGNEKPTPVFLNTIGTNPNRKLARGLIDSDETLNYELHLWIDKDADSGAMGKVISLKLRVDAYQITNNIISGSFADKLVKKGTKGSISSVSGDGLDSDNEEDGLYKYMDKETTLTYVYRGINPNNYVTFAGQTWRVLRIQEDGTVKLVRNSFLNFESDKTGGSESTYKTVKYADDYEDVDKVKYSNSNIKLYIDEWYNSEMLAYDSKIATNDYCSDTTMDNSSPLYNTFLGIEDVADDYFVLYGLFNRLTYDYWNGSGSIQNPVLYPSVSCRAQDIVSTKAALITADEIALAGAPIIFNESEGNTYLSFDGNVYWSMSPLGFIDGGSLVYGMEDGVLSIGPPDAPLAALPVITLKADVKSSSGNGTSDNPYVID